MRANKSTLSLIVIVFQQSTQQPALYNIYAGLQIHSNTTIQFVDKKIHSTKHDCWVLYTGQTCTFGDV